MTSQAIRGIERKEHPQASSAHWVENSSPATSSKLAQLKASNKLLKSPILIGNEAARFGPSQPVAVNLFSKITQLSQRQAPRQSALMQ